MGWSPNPSLGGVSKNKVYVPNRLHVVRLREYLVKELWEFIIKDQVATCLLWVCCKFNYTSSGTSIICVILIFRSLWRHKGGISTILGFSVWWCTGLGFQDISVGQGTPLRYKFFENTSFLFVLCFSIVSIISWKHCKKKKNRYSMLQQGHMILQILSVCLNLDHASKTGGHARLWRPRLEAPRG